MESKDERMANNMEPIIHISQKFPLKIKATKTIGIGLTKYENFKTPSTLDSSISTFSSSFPKTAFASASFNKYKNKATKAADIRK